MTIRFRSTVTLFLSIVVALSFGACTEDSPTGPSSPLLGTWIITESEGLDVSQLQYSYHFAETQLTITADEGCKTRADYSVSGTTLISTLLSDECFNSPPGARDTAEFSVSGDQLLIFSDGDTTVLMKGTPNPVYLKGSWTVETIDGESLPAGSGMTLDFTLNQLTMTGTGTGACIATFTYYKDMPGWIYLTTQSDECLTTFPDDFFEGTYTVTPSTLTLMFNEMTIVAKRG